MKEPMPWQSYVGTNFPSGLDFYWHFSKQWPVFYSTMAKDFLPKDREWIQVIRLPDRLVEFFRQLYLVNTLDEDPYYNVALREGEVIDRLDFIENDPRCKKGYHAGPGCKGGYESIRDRNVVPVLCSHVWSLRTFWESEVLNEFGTEEFRRIHKEDCGCDKL